MLQRTRTLDSLKRKANPRPPIILLYGVPGIGKTSFGASMPEPVFIQTEDGLGLHEGRVNAFELCQSWEDVQECMSAMMEAEPGQFGSLVVDSLDHLEPMLHDFVCRSQKPVWESIETPGYGRGYVEAERVWMSFFSDIQTLRDTKNLAVLLIAHSRVKAFNSPMLQEAYDRFEIKLHKHAASKAIEVADMVLFANQRVAIKGGDPKKGIQAKGIGNGDRVLYTEERPAFLAKNRYGLPDCLPFPSEGAFDQFMPFVPYYAQFLEEQK